MPKVNEKLEKLDQSDNYDIVAGADVGGFPELESEVSAIKAVIAAGGEGVEPSRLSYIHQDTAVKGLPFRTMSTHDEAILFADTVVSHGDNIGDQAFNRSFSISTKGNDKEYYLILLRVAPVGRNDSTKPVKLAAYLYGENSNQDYDDDNLIVDVNGFELSKEVSVEVGEDYPTVTIGGVVEVDSTKLIYSRFCDDHIDGSDLILGSRYHGGTCLLIQKVTDLVQSSPAQQQFELDTSHKINFTAHKWDTLSSLTYGLVSNPIVGNVALPKEITREFGDFRYYGFNDATYTNTSQHIQFRTSSGQNRYDFMFYSVLPSEGLGVLEGLQATLNCAIKTNIDLEIRAYGWKGDGDLVPDALFTGRSGGLGDGDLVPAANVAFSAVLSTIPAGANFESVSLNNVPLYDDVTVSNVGIVIYPKSFANTAVEVYLESVELTLPAPVYSYSSVTTTEGSHINIDGKQINELVLETPLEVIRDEVNKTDTLIIKPNTYEPMNAPGMLSALEKNTPITGKALSATAHHDSVVWFGDHITRVGSGINTESQKKEYIINGIEKTVSTDGSESYNSKYLIALYIAPQGTNEDIDNGFIRAYLYDTTIAPYSENGILKDINGNFMAAQASYTQHQRFKPMLIAGVVDSGFAKSFSVHVQDTFTDYRKVVAGDRMHGGSCLLIQKLDNEAQTGAALRQFEIDTGIHMKMLVRNIGKLASLDYYLNHANNVSNSEVALSEFRALGDYTLSAITSTFVTKTDSEVVLTGQSSGTTDFVIYQMLDASTTELLRGEDLNVTLSASNINTPFKVYALLWEGDPDQWTDTLYTVRNGTTGDTTPKLWDGYKLGIPQIIVGSDVTLDDHVHTFEFKGANYDNTTNLGFMLVPDDSVQNPNITIKKLSISTREERVFYSLPATETFNEKALRYSQGHAITRFTNHSKSFVITNAPTNMPIGALENNPDVPITQDYYTNAYTQSGEPSAYEGAFQCNFEGELHIKANLLVRPSPSLDVGVQRNIKFWLVSYDPDSPDISREIPGTAYDVLVAGGSVRGQEVEYPLQHIVVTNGTKIGMRAQTDEVNGMFFNPLNANESVVSFFMQADIIAADLTPAAPQMHDGTYESAKQTEMLRFPFDNNTSSVISIDSFNLSPGVFITDLTAIEFAQDDYHNVENIDWTYDPDGDLIKVSFGGQKPLKGDVFIKLSRFEPVDAT